MDNHYPQLMDFAEQVAELYTETGDRTLSVTARRENGVIWMTASMTGGDPTVVIDEDAVSSLEHTRLMFETYAAIAISMADLVALAHATRERPKTIKVVAGGHSWD
ncbi:hypothetical protein [Vreelandella alkaliphila]|uniref:hypothetical protein n=1 Tax=Vreelandella alkaliphila TaxID=272774 RepID=UPI003F94F0B4